MTAVQPTIEMAASFYEMLFRDYNPENAEFFVLFGVITLMGAFAGTLPARLLSRGSGEQNTEKGEQHDGKRTLTVHGRG